MKLIIEDDEGRKTVVPLARDEMTIGRQDGNTIRLTERNVSRRHARLLKENGKVLIEDLGSYNGVRVNGDKITERTPIKEGDLVEIGDYDLGIQGKFEASTAASAASSRPATIPPSTRASAQARPATLTPQSTPVPGAMTAAAGAGSVATLMTAMTNDNVKTRGHIFAKRAILIAGVLPTNTLRSARCL